MCWDWGITHLSPGQKPVVTTSQLGSRSLFWITSDCGAGGRRESMPVFLYLEMLYVNLKTIFSSWIKASFTCSGLWFCLYLCFILRELLWNRICWRQEVFFLCLISLHRTLVAKKRTQMEICASAPHMKVCLFKRLELQDLIPNKAKMDGLTETRTLRNYLLWH